jgi:hypothetical protein
MGFTPSYPFLPGVEPDRDRKRAEELARTNFDKTQRMLNLLPTNRELIDAMISQREVA